MTSALLEDVDLWRHGELRWWYLVDISRKILSPTLSPIYVVSFPSVASRYFIWCQVRQYSNFFLSYGFRLFGIDALDKHLQSDESCPIKIPHEDIMKGFDSSTLFNAIDVMRCQFGGQTSGEARFARHNSRVLRISRCRPACMSCCLRIWSGPTILFDLELNL